MNKRNQCALITGGSRGIGFGIAEQFAAKGFDLAINGVRDEREVSDKLATLRSFGVRVVYCRGNIGLATDREAIVKKASDEFETIHVLVNNAGVAPKVRADVLEMTEESFDYVMDINLKGTFFLTQAIAKKMIVSKKFDPSFKGSIINVTSISAEVASLNRGEYCMAKAGLGMMTKLLASRLGDDAIPVYEIRPGIIDTDMTAGVKEKYDKLFAEGIAIEKRWGKPEDIGKIAVTLAEGNLPYATGQVIYADGGMNVRRL